jgi:hypothetical protein
MKIVDRLIGQHAPHQRFKFLTFSKVCINHQSRVIKSAHIKAIEECFQVGVRRVRMAE